MSYIGDKRTQVLKGNGDSVSPATAKEGPLYILRVFALIILSVVVQTTLAPHLTVLGAKPDSALVMVVCVALIRGPFWGATTGFSTGLLLDVALMQTLGISSLIYTLAGYFNGRYGPGIDTGSWLRPLIMVFATTMIAQFVNAVIMFLLGIEASVGFVLFRVVLPTAVLNALLAAPVFVVTRWWLGGEKAHSLFTES